MSVSSIPHLRDVYPFVDEHEDNLFGDINMVNGVPWPVMSVKAKYHRFRVGAAAVTSVQEGTCTRARSSATAIFMQSTHLPIFVCSLLQVLNSSPSRPYIIQVCRLLCVCAIACSPWLGAALHDLCLPVSQ